MASATFTRLQHRAALEDLEVVTGIDGEGDLTAKLSEVDDEQVGVIEGEVAEIEAEVVEATQDAESLDDEAEKVEVITEAVEAFAAEGGIHPQTARLLHNTLAENMASLGMETYSLNANNFDGAAGRENATVPALENIKEYGAKIITWIKETLKRLAGLLSDLWSKVSLQAKRVEARAKKIIAAVGEVKNTGAVEVKVGNNPYLYDARSGAFLGNSVGNVLKKFVGDLGKYYAAAPAIAKSGTVSVGESASKGPFDGDQKVVARLPSGKGVFVKVADGVFSVAVGGSVEIKLTATDNMTASDAKGIATGVSEAVKAFAALKPVSEAVKTAEAELTKTVKDGEQDAVKAARKTVAALRTLTSKPAGINAAFLSACSANLALAGRILSAAGKGDKKKKDEAKKD